MTATLLVLVPILPLVLACCVHRSATARAIAPWVPLAALALLPLSGRVVELPWLLLATRLGVEPVMVPLLVLAAVVWTLAGWHARRTLAGAGAARFWFFWLATWCGNLGALITLDAASFYAAYAMMTFAAWGLVVHNRQPADFHAGRVYIVMAVMGEGLILAGLFQVAAQAGNLPLGAGAGGVAALAQPGWAAALLAGGFAVKMGLAGVHMWLPLAHPRAPVPASAVLSGVILKAGLVGWLHFLPLGTAGFAGLGTVLLTIGLVTAFFGVAIGLCQAGAKAVLAYSSLSQMGLVAALVALGIRFPDTAPAAVAAAVLLALHHGLAKALLFLGVDFAAAAPARARRLLWIPAAALAGLPPTSGALAKAAFKGALPAGASGLGTVLLASSIATTLLMIHFLARLAAASSGGGGRARTPPGVAGPWFALLAASLLLPWSFAEWTAPGLLARPFAPSYLVEGVLPVVAGVVLAGVAGYAARRLGATALRLPPGDVLALLPQPGRITLQPQLPRVRGRAADAALGAIERCTRRLSLATALWLLFLAALAAVAAWCAG